MIGVGLRGHNLMESRTLLAKPFYQKQLFLNLGLDIRIQIRLYSSQRLTKRYFTFILVNDYKMFFTII